MNFSEVLKALNDASSFELHRMRAAIDVVLDSAARTEAILSQLKIGQKIEYFDSRDNRTCFGTILELRRKKALVRDPDDGKRWLIEYPSINLDGADVKILQTGQHGLSRNEVAVGETVGFLDRYGQQRSGRVTRLNTKSASVLVGTANWRVGYSLLHRVMEAEVIEQQARVIIEHDAP